MDSQDRVCEQVCELTGHIVICGWNTRGRYLVSELLASGRQIAVVSSEDLRGLPQGVSFTRGNPSDQEALLKTGIKSAKAAIILWPGDDSQAILTGLTVGSVAPDVYTVMELHDPENERYARYARVNEVLCADKFIADITGICTHYEGLSAFIEDIFSASDDGHSFASFDVPVEFEGRPLRELFADLQGRLGRPVGVLVPGDASGQGPQWVSHVDPELDAIVTLPMKAVCIVKDHGSVEVGITFGGPAQ